MSAWMILKHKNHASPHTHAPMPVRRALQWGLLLTLAQLVFVVMMQPRPAVDSFVRLNQWDAKDHYQGIVENWYHSTVYPGQDLSKGIQGGTNVSFFPSFPMVARLLMRATGATAAMSMHLVSILATWAFWTYLLLLLGRLKIRSVAPVVLLAAAYPSAFFIIAPYSESMFCASVLGYIYWCDRDLAEGKSWIIAALHGLLMTSTKLIGVPIAVLPVVLHLIHRKPLKKIEPAIGLAAASCLGIALFFGYSAWQFGYWNLYMETQHNWWGVNPDYFFLFREHTPLFLPEFSDWWSLGSDNLSRVFVVILLWFALALGITELVLRWRGHDKTGAWKQRAALYWCAGGAYFIACAGVYSKGMTSMIRYSYLPYLLLIIAFVHIVDTHRSGFKRLLSTHVIGFVAFWFLYLQFVLLLRYTDGNWVA